MGMTTTVDMSPDDELFITDIARLLGVKKSTIEGYRSRPLKINPFPVEDGRKADGAFVRPFWRRSVIDAWVAARPTRGRWGERPKVSDLG